MKRIQLVIDTVVRWAGRMIPDEPPQKARIRRSSSSGIRRSYHVTSNPHWVTISGSSYGGLAATYAGLKHPETFGNVLSQSGSYWWTPPTDPAIRFSSGLDADPNYVAQLFVANPKLPLRFYLDAGSMELDMSGHGGS
jgi:enterochelin esterase family protein